MNGSRLANVFVQWAQQEPCISALNLIGSQVRPDDEVGAADKYSDWDFQLVVRRPGLFANSRWLKAAGLPVPLAYVVRRGRLGSSTKISVVFPEAALDLVLIPAFQFRLVKWLCTFGLVDWNAHARTGLANLSLVLRSGYRLLKGEEAWGRFFQHVKSNFPPVRLDDEKIVMIAEGYVCDHVSAQQKISRGEFLAAQRWLHVQLTETNFRLLHELRQRAGEATFPDARRIERVAGDCWTEAVTVRAVPARESLQAAIDKNAQTFRELVAALVGTKWRWPEKLPLRLRGE